MEEEKIGEVRETDKRDKRKEKKKETEKNIRGEN